MTLEEKIKEIIESHLEIPNSGYFKTRLEKFGEEGLEEMITELADLFDEESREGRELIDSL